MTTPSQTIKKAVVEAVFGDLQTAIMEDFAASGDPILRQSAVEVHPISALQIQVRIKTPNDGAHYYAVRVSEVM